MAYLFAEWLYVDAPRAYLRYIKALSVAFFEYFSISLMFQTLTAPWRQDTIPLTRIPARYWSQAILSNAVSRTIGFFVRFSVIIAGCLTLFVINLGFLLFMVTWYLLPILLVLSIAFGFRLLTGGLWITS